jgi:hypothetical protein
MTAHRELLKWPQTHSIPDIHRRLNLVIVPVVVQALNPDQDQLPTAVEARVGLEEADDPCQIRCHE